jgi:hypothetical protein
MRLAPVLLLSLAVALGACSSNSSDSAKADGRGTAGGPGVADSIGRTGLPGAGAARPGS